MIELLRRDEGSAHLLLFALFGIAAAAFLWVTAFNWMLQTHSLTKTKPLLDRAAQAAALNIDRREAALGRLVWDRVRGTDDFYKYLRLNLKLGQDLTPLPGSHLEQPPIVHLLEHVSSPTYPYVLNRSITVHSSTDQQTTRSVNVTIYGPSIVAIIEVNRSLLGHKASEPIVLSSVASVRLR